MTEPTTEQLRTQQLSGARILVTGATGQVGRPVATALAAGNEVVAAARFTDTAAQAALEAAGVRCVHADLVTGDVAGVPADVDYVLHFGVVKSNDWAKDLDGNAGGVGALMARCASARAFLHCSSTAVYQPDGNRAFAESDPLGDNHRSMPFLSTYSISKIAAEAMARFGARQFGLPTTIARLNVPYGVAGWPGLHLAQILAGQPVMVHRDGPTVYNPIHDDDILAMVPRLLDVASVPATVVNWAGEETVSVEEWCAYLGELVGREPAFEAHEMALPSVAVDLSEMHRLVGRATVGWKDGFRRLVEHLHPEALVS